MTAETITNPSESPLSQRAGVEALLTGVAFAPLANLGFIRITGEDRVRWLNGMVTNSIQALKPGEGCYSFFLNAQGRIQADAIAWLNEDSILLETQRERVPAVITHLDHFIIMDDVELKNVSDEGAGLTLIGPQAGTILTDLGLHPPAELELSHTTFMNSRLDLLQAHSPLIARYELWAAPETIAAVKGAVEKAGVLQASSESLEALRILEGTPLFGTDIRDKELPQETAQTRALHFAKGCYLGQEIVERIRSRGNVHRTFAGFMLTGALPASGTSLFAETSDKPVGEITSAAEIPLPTGPITLALGYLRREVLDRGIQLTYEGGSAIPTTLPYKP
jgi:folate-binding protein YgfZ